MINVGEILMKIWSDSGFAAIASGDADLASKLITAHICNAKEHMIERFDYHG